MDIENQEVIYCEDDRGYRIYCKICDKLCVERFYKNPLKSSTHTNINRKGENKIETSERNESKRHRCPPNGRISSKLLFWYQRQQIKLNSLFKSLQWLLIYSRLWAFFWKKNLLINVIFKLI